MLAIRRTLLIALACAATCSVADAKDPREVDVTKRQPNPAEQKVPMRVQDPKMASRISDKRMPITRWHGEFSSIGQRRSSISVRETNQKNMVKPQIVPMNRLNRKTAPQNGRVAFVRNFDHVRENKKVEKFRDARVVNVQEAARAAPTREKENKEVSMRDVNRFTFHRNQYEEGPVRVQQPGSGESK